MNNIKDTIKDSVLERITSEHLTPTSRWYFLVRHAALWTPGVLVTALGSFAVAGILFSTVHSGWEYRSYTHQNIGQFLVQAIPLIWVASLALFGGAIVQTLRMTSNGYKYKASAILIVSFGCSIVFGSAIFTLDMTVKRNELIRSHAEHMQRMIWSSPEQGRIVGLVELDDNTFFITDTDGKVWTLDVSDLANKEFLIPETSVRIIGGIYDENIFSACLIAPWDLTPFPKGIGALPTPHIGIQNPLSEKCSIFLGENRIK